MSHVVASYVCRKNVFYNQTSLKGISTFSTISLTLSIASVIPVLLKPFIAISLSSLRVLHRSTIHFACGGLTTGSLRETLKVTSAKKEQLLKMCYLRHRLRIFLFHRKVMFRSQDIQIFVFLAISSFTKSVTS